MLDLTERFWSKVDKTSACWLWTGTGNGKGYGQFWWHGRCAMAHRLSYEAAHGTIPAGMVIDHICHTPACVNPEHLRVATPKQNVENRGLFSNNKSGRTGVRFDPSSGKWMARVKNNGHELHLGSFATVEEAAEAARAARNILFTFNDADRHVH